MLQAIEPSLHEKLPVQDLVNNIHSQYPKALGVNWDSNLDTMSTSLCLPEHFESTKRADVARIFDILGWLASTVVRMKIVHQHVWEDKLDWDAPLPN